MTYRIELSVRALLDREALYLEKNVADSQSAARWFNGLQEASNNEPSFPTAAPSLTETRERSGN